MFFSGKKRQKKKKDFTSRNSQNRRELTKKKGVSWEKSYYTHVFRHTYTLTK